MKMEDHFALPVGDGKQVIVSTANAAWAAAAYAINCHDELVACVEAFRSHGCPVCGGDCGSANPPVVSCPMRMASAILTKAKGE